MPRLRTILKHVSELEPAERQVLKGLNLGYMGRMQGMFLEAWYKKTGWVVMHKSSTGQIDGWTLLFPDLYQEYGTDRDELVGYFFVDPGARRQGIGTALMRHARIVAPEPYVVPWSDESAGFFGQQDCIQVESRNKTRYGLEKARGR